MQPTLILFRFILHLLLLICTAANRTFIHILCEDREVTHHTLGLTVSFDLPDGSTATTSRTISASGPRIREFRSEGHSLRSVSTAIHSVSRQAASPRVVHRGRGAVSRSSGSERGESVDRGRWARMALGFLYERVLQIELGELPHPQPTLRLVGGKQWRSRVRLSKSVAHASWSASTV